MTSDLIEQNKEEKPRAHFGNVITILTSPAKTFSRVVDAGHSWIFPFIVITIIMLISFLIDNPSYQSSAFESMPLGMNDGINMHLIYIISLIMIMIITPIIIFLILFLIPALIYLFFGNVVFERQVKFRQSLNIAAYSAVPFIVGSLVGMTITGLSGNSHFSFSPAVFLSFEMQQTFLGMWIGLFNLFTIWQVLLTISGLSVLFRHSKTKTASWLIPLYLVIFTFFVLMLSITSVR